MTTQFNTYTEYLEKSTSPYIKSEAQFNKEINLKLNETVPTKIFNGIFQSVDFMVPHRLKGMGSLMKISILLGISYLKNQNNFMKCTYVACAVSAAVFFYPQTLSRFPSHQFSSYQLFSNNQSN